jgi:TonB family protein
MGRVLNVIVMTCVLSAVALAQEHKISVQKFEPPVYPQIARQARITGEVKLALEVAADGSVRDVKVISGHPILVPASKDAIKNWRFHCDDCAYGSVFRHEITFAFKIDDEKQRVSAYHFPDKVVIYAVAPIIETQTSAARTLQ